MGLLGSAGECVIDVKVRQRQIQINLIESQEADDRGDQFKSLRR